MKIFITGSSGFIGKNFIECLQTIHTIYAIPHKDLDLLDAMQVADFFGQNQIDIIIHCATIGGARKSGYDVGATDVVEKNLRVFFNIVRCLRPGMHLFTFGSGAEYDKSNVLAKVSEDFFDASVPTDAYGFSKTVISKYAANADNITCLRLFGVYGKYEDYTYKFISNAIVKNLLHLPIVINQNVVFDYLFIEDLVRIVAQMVAKPPQSKCINLTPTESIDLVTIANIVNEIGDYESEIVVLNSGLNKEYSGSNECLRAEIGDFQFTPYRVGISELYEYYAMNLDSLDQQTIREDLYLKYCKTKVENTPENDSENRIL